MYIPLPAGKSASTSKNDITSTEEKGDHKPAEIATTEEKGGGHLAATATTEEKGDDHLAEIATTEEKGDKNLAAIASTEETGDISTDGPVRASSFLGRLGVVMIGHRSRFCFYPRGWKSSRRLRAAVGTRALSVIRTKGNCDVSPGFWQGGLVLKLELALFYIDIE